MFFPNGKARTGWRLSNYETHLGDFAQAVVDNTDMELNIVDYMDKSVTRHQPFPHSQPLPRPHSPTRRELIESQDEEYRLSLEVDR